VSANQPAMRLDVSGTVAVAGWWWTFILRGVLAVAFGALAFFAPAFGLAVLVALFGIWMFIDGAGGLYAALRTRGRDRSWWLEGLEGLAGIAAGLVALLAPLFAAEVLVILIAAWAFVTGIVEIWTAVRLRDRIHGEFWLGLAGAASVLFAVILVAYPAAGALSLVWLIGSFAIVFGGFLLVLGWRLRTIDRLARTDAAHDYG
jgi:uncharacterized membrane protein HdeD (DUF308 family)